MMLITFIDGLLFSLLSILVVISIIGLILLSISPLKRLSHNKKPIQPVKHQKQTLTDDMMIAILVASIDFKETEQKDPKVISIKEFYHENL